MGKLLTWFCTIKDTCPDCIDTGYRAPFKKGEDELPCPDCEGKGYVIKEVELQSEKFVPSVSIEDKSEDLIRGKVDGNKRLISEKWEREFVCHTCSGKKVISRKQIESKSDFICTSCHGSGTRLKKKKIALLSFLALLVIILPYLTFLLIGLWAFFFGLWVAFRETFLKGEDDNEL